MASYELFKHSIEQAEGGYQNLEKDTGNYNSLKQRVGTNRGISAEFYEKVIGRPPTIADMKAITKEEAHFLFESEFWDKMLADNIQSQAVAEMITDHAINTGNPRTAKMVQRILNNHFGKSLRVDGVIGAKTLQAINSVNSQQLFAHIGVKRIAFYKTRRNYIHFAKTWHRRIEELANKFGISLSETLKKKRQKQR